MLWKFSLTAQGDLIDDVCCHSFWHALRMDDELQMEHRGAPQASDATGSFDFMLELVALHHQVNVVLAEKPSNMRVAEIDRRELVKFSPVFFLLASCIFRLFFWLRRGDLVAFCRLWVFELDWCQFFREIIDFLKMKLQALSFRTHCSLTSNSSAFSFSHSAFSDSNLLQLSHESQPFWNHLSIFGKFRLFMKKKYFQSKLTGKKILIELIWRSRR